MRTDERHLQENHEHAALSPHITRTEEQAIVAEIAARFIQWRSLHPLCVESRPFFWLMRLAHLGKDSPDGLWLYLHLQSGDLTSLTRTYQEQATERGTSRQAIEQRRAKAVEAMQAHFPELSSVIHDLDKHFRPHRGINHGPNHKGPINGHPHQGE